MHTSMPAGWRAVKYHSLPPCCYACTGTRTQHRKHAAHGLGLLSVVPFPWSSLRNEETGAPRGARRAASWGAIIKQANLHTLVTHSYRGNFAFMAPPCGANINLPSSFRVSRSRRKGPKAAMLQSPSSPRAADAALITAQPPNP